MRYISTQYSINNYRIDLYFIDYKLAIECDEHNHVDRNKEYEKIREELNCTFIKFNPHEKCFNIGNVISKILKHIREYK